MDAPYASQIEVFQHWGDSLLRVERFSRWSTLTVGPAATSHFVAEGDAPTVLVARGAVHADSGPVEITADTDVLIDVGDQTFRVRAVPAERRLGGAFFAHVDWFFVGVMLVGLLVLILGTVVTLVAIVLFLLFRYLLAMLLAIFSLTAPAFLQMPAPVIPPPVIVVSASIAPPSAPAPPLFIRATPTPVPTIAPIPIGDIRSNRVAISKRQIAKLQSLTSREFAVLGALESRDSHLSGIFGSIESGGSLGGLKGVGTGTAGDGGGDLAGMGGLGIRGSGGGGDIAIGVAKKASEVEEPDEFLDGGVEGGVAGGVVGGVVFGTIERSPPPVIGVLSKEEISRGIQAHLAKIQYCYEQALLADPQVEGKVVVNFRIDPTGRVQNARVLSSTIPSIDRCVLSQVRTMRFRESGGSVNASYPFVFRSAQ